MIDPTPFLHLEGWKILLGGFIFLILSAIISLLFKTIIRYILTIINKLSYETLWHVFNFIGFFVLIGILSLDSNKSTAYNYFFDQELISKEILKKDSVYLITKARITQNYTESFHRIDSLREIFLKERESYNSIINEFHNKQIMIEELRGRTGKVYDIRNDMLNNMLAALVLFIIGLIVSLEKVRK
jgi:hypothetical protein